MNQGVLSTSHAEKDGCLVRADKFLRSNWHRIMAETGTVLVAIGRLSQLRYGWAFTVLGLALATSGHLFEWIRLPYVTDLQRKVDSVEDALDQTKQDMQQLLTSELRRLIDGTSAMAEAERVSIYRHSMHADSFSLAGRYSRNPEYCKEGRDEYPLGADIISNAWMNGEAVSDTLPDPARRRKAYLKTLSKQGIDEATADALTMKSRRLYAKAVGDGDRLRSRLAVVVFESTTPRGLDFSDLCRNSLTLEEEDRICDLLGSARQPGYQSGNMASGRGM